MFASHSVLASKKTVKTAVRFLSNAAKKKVVIVGGGPAGRVVVHGIHASPLRDNFDVKLIKEESTNVNRCSIPYGISGVKPLEKYLIPNKLVTDFGAELIVDKVEEITRSDQVVHTRSGKSYNYDYLVIATGAQPIKPKIPGINAKNVCTVRSKEDLLMLRNAAGKAKKAVIAGGGYIGLEVAVALKQMGVDSTIVEACPTILHSSVDEIFARQIEDRTRRGGVKVITERKVAEFVTKDGNLSHVLLDNGDEIDADFAVVSVGVKPMTDLASRAGLNVSSKGIITNERLQCDGDGRVFTAGDSLEKKSIITGKPINGEFGTNAVFTGKVVAQNILGKNVSFPGVINASVSTSFDYGFGGVGLREDEAQREGLSVVSGYSEVLDRYPMINGSSLVKTKLVFDVNTRKLVGGAVLREKEAQHATAINVDFLSFAIQMGATIDSLLIHQYSTHPELAAKPSDNTIVFAAKDADKK